MFECISQPRSPISLSAEMKVGLDLGLNSKIALSNLNTAIPMFLYRSRLKQACLEARN